jgi:hypothetical protein
MSQLHDRDDAFDEVFGTAIDKAVRRAIDRIGRDPLAHLPEVAGDGVEDPVVDDEAPADAAPERTGIRPRTAAEVRWQQHGQPSDLALPKGRLHGVNPHAVLGVSRTATWEQISAAYRRRARAWHPDGADEAERPRREELIRQLNGAYNELRSRHASARHRTGPT